MSIDKSKPLLMSRTNPDGFTMEEIVDKLSQELVIKKKDLTGDLSLVAVAVTRNNEEIVELFQRIKVINDDTVEVLNNLAKDGGPTSPRIGGNCDG